MSVVAYISYVPFRFSRVPPPPSVSVVKTKTLHWEGGVLQMADLMGAQRMVNLLLNFFDSCFRMLDYRKTRRNTGEGPVIKDGFRTEVCFLQPKQRYKGQPQSRTAACTYLTSTCPGHSFTTRLRLSSRFLRSLDIATMHVVYAGTMPSTREVL